MTAPAVVFDDQHDFLAAFADGELDGRDFVAVIRYQGPAANGMPELHKLTPALGVLQDRGQKVAIVTDGRMSGASGKVPAAIHVTPEAALGGPLSRIQDGDVDHRRRRRRAARPARRPRRLRPPTRSPAGRRRAPSGPAPAASCSRRSAPPSGPPTPAPASSRASPPLARRSPCPARLSSPTPLRARRRPGDAGRRRRLPGPRRADRTRPGRRRPAGHRADAAHDRSALDAIRAIAAEVPEILVGAGTIATPGQAKEALDAGAQFLVSPGTTGSLLHAMQDTGLPFLPGTATVSEALAALEAGMHGDEVLPGRGVGRHGVPQGGRLARAGGPLLPDRWDHARHRRRRTSRCRTSAASAAPGSPRPTRSRPATGTG